MTKDDAIKHFGSASALAEALAVTRQAVSDWQQIPLGRQYQLQVLTGGELVADRHQPKMPEKNNSPLSAAR